jgi:hypothetical protein
MAGESFEVFLIEYVRNAPHAGEYSNYFTISGSNAGAFLTAVLEGEKGEKAKASYILFRGIDAKNAARLVQDLPLPFSTS